MTRHLTKLTRTAHRRAQAQEVVDEIDREVSVAR